MNTTLQWGGPNGLPVMKFVLTFDGELAASGSPAQKWDIRRALHPQLDELWKTDPILKEIYSDRFVPKTGSYFRLEQHHYSGNSTATQTTQLGLSSEDSDRIDLCAPIPVGARKFIPLIRDSYALKCGLKILFLRKEPPGRLYQGGDLDNRLKTLFDGLAAPNPDSLANDGGAPDPTYTLLEDDRLITAVEVETRQLLSRPGASKHEVRLIIEVDVRVSRARSYNQPFLGT
jgi:hypothetical protein